MEIKLDQLTLENFKGCRRRTLDFQGRGAAIYGENGTGKSTIYDAFTWLLSGKDSAGRSDFKIKPQDSDGSVADHAAVTAVEAVLSVDNAPLRLRRTYYERWSTKRGSAEAAFDGNTSEFFIDGVPLKKGEYESRIGELVEEGLFQTLTNVSWFCEGLDWRTRRDMLFQVCRLPEDREILAGEARFAPLAAAMGGQSLEDYRKKLMARRKGINADRNTIPARLDEQKKNVEALSGYDFPALRARRDGTAAKLEQLRSELLKLGHGALLDARRNELAAAKNAVAEEVNRNNAHRQSQARPVEDRRPDIRAAMDKAASEAARWRRLAAGEADTIRDLVDKIQLCRASWAAENAKTFQPGNCPTCGQTLPGAAQRAAEERFAADRASAMQAAIDRADEHKAALTAAQSRREEYIQAAAGEEERVNALRTELEAYRPETPPEILDLPGHAERLADAEARVRALTVEVEKLEGESAAIRSEITDRANALRAEVETLDGELAKEAMLDFARKRSEELREEARNAAAILSEVDRMLYLCEEFTRYKARFVEDRVNSRFRLARWKLYEEQVNGGLSDCCEAMYDGVPYAALNHGMRVNLGVDVIRTLSGHYGLKAPLFMDNAESVTALADAGTQVIRLVVSETDKELRCEYEN